jgi:aminoglycoside phosphotransferase
MLPNVEHLSSLKKLDVSQCPKLQWSAAVIEQLRQRLGQGFVQEEVSQR